jgi:hypothetical protein
MQQWQKIIFLDYNEVNGKRVSREYQIKNLSVIGSSMNEDLGA